MSRAVLLSRTALVSALLTACAFAQVPPGWGAYSKMSRNGGRAGGVLMFDPVLGNYTIVTDLPFQLVGGSAGGARAILVDDSDGSIFAGDCCRTQASIYHMFLTGSRVTSVTQANLGPADSGGNLVDMTRLPNGKLIVIYNNVTSRNPNSGLMTFNPANNRFSGAFGGPGIGTPQAVSVDPTGTDLYVAYLIGDIWTVPLDRSTPTLLTTFSGGVTDMDVNADGDLIAVTPSRGVWIVDPTTGAQTRLAGNLDAPTAMAIEPVSGDVIMTSVQSGNARMFFVDASGTATRAGNMPTADRPTGMDIRSSLLPYGTQSPSNPYTWKTGLNPGGAPRYGNTAFSLTVTSSGATPPGLLLLGLASLPAPVAFPPFADNLLVDLNRLLINVAWPASAVSTIGLPLPASTSTRGVDLWAQPLHAHPATVFPFVGAQGLQLHIH